MTALALAPTSTAPTGRALWGRARGPLAVLALLVAAAVTVAAVKASGEGGRLDPRSYAPGGSRAVATLLADRGVPVRVVADLTSLSAAAGPASTVVVPRPGALTVAELRAVARLGARLVVVGAVDRDLDALGVPVQAVPAGLEVRDPACELPAARAAGPALTGGTAYVVTDGSAADGCYAAEGHPSLLAVGGGRTTLLGSGQALTNAALADEGNAALAVGLLSDGGPREVLWLVPAAGRAVPGGPTAVRDLLPPAVPLGALQLAVAVVLLALARGRRLGRVVAEPLPVAVRSAEAVEGRGRLYRAAHARDAAAAALRAGTRDRLGTRLSLPAADGAQALVSRVARASGREPGAVADLLYGAAPADDGALVRLADDLDQLAREVPA